MNEWLDVNIDKTRLLSYSFHENAVKWNVVQTGWFDIIHIFWFITSSFTRIAWTARKQKFGGRLRSRCVFTSHFVVTLQPLILYIDNISHSHIFQPPKSRVCCFTHRPFTCECVCVSFCVCAFVLFCFVLFSFDSFIFTHQMLMLWCVATTVTDDDDDGDDGDEVGGGSAIAAACYSICIMYLFLHVVGSTNTLAHWFNSQLQFANKWTHQMNEENDGNEWKRDRERERGGKWSREQKWVPISHSSIFIFRLSNVYAMLFTLHFSSCSVYYTHVHISWMCLGLFWLYNCQQP